MEMLTRLREGRCSLPQEPFISIPLDIADVHILQTDLTAAGEFILTVESTLTSRRWSPAHV